MTVTSRHYYTAKGIAVLGMYSTGLWMRYISSGCFHINSLPWLRPRMIIITLVSKPKSMEQAAMVYYLGRDKGKFYVGGDRRLRSHTAHTTQSPPP